MKEKFGKKLIVIYTKFLRYIFFILVLVCSFITVIYSQKYDVLSLHDLGFPYGRLFLHPEHGRYIATYTNNLLTEILPEYLNIHPNDFQQTFVIPLKAICIVLVCTLLTNSAFIFSKRKTIADIFNPVFSILYLLVFLVLYNDENIISNCNYRFLHVFENTVFWEYIMSIPLYLLFFSVIVYLCIYTYKIYISRKVNYMLGILTFLLGISVEPINVPVFIGLTIFFIRSYIQEKRKLYNKKNNKYLKFLAKIFIIYSISIILYYYATIKQFHHEFNFGNNSLSTYFVEQFLPFIKAYFTSFLSKDSIMLLPILIITTYLIISKNQYNYTYKKNFLSIISTSIAGFLIFYFSSFFIGINDGRYFLFFDKWVYTYKVIILFWFLLSLGYLTDMNKTISEKQSQRIKIFLCFLIFIIFNKSLILNFPKNINSFVEDQKTERTAAYIAEKELASGKEEVFLPQKYKNIYIYDLWFDDEIPCSFEKYVKFVHPDNINIKKRKIIYKDYTAEEVLSKEELNELTFQKLLTFKMYRHKKTTYSCY